MNHIIEALNSLPIDPVALAAGKDNSGIVPEFTPALPDNLKGITGQVLGWATGIGIVCAVLGQILGWSMVAIGHSTERSEMATRGKRSAFWSLLGGMLLATPTGLVMLFYTAAKGGN
ncbi:hypothetical protein [Streptomyces sp. NPDC056672]|uniref:hypothetical protein n=1 Tax=Streptomyces sp. NPDC056672 TaxID=3345906 RepID=UPI00369A7AA2